MSDAEKIARYFIEPFKSCMPDSDIKDEELEAHIIELQDNIEAHTNQTLKELKEKVEEKLDNHIVQYKEELVATNEEATQYGSLRACEDIITLIDKAINE